MAVVPVRIPLSSCNRAADALIEWFGPDELKRVVGGERWWQVRGLEWIDAEWITEKAFLKDILVPDDVHQSDEENTIKRMEQLDRVLVRMIRLILHVVFTDRAGWKAIRTRR